MKKFTKLAATAALLAPMAAIAAGPTLYGKVHLSADLIDNGNDSDLNLASNSSRLGVKGSEGISGGLKVGYKMEWEVDMADKSSKDLGIRNRYLTFSGDFGTTILGTLDIPFKSLGRKADLFGDRVGDFRNMTYYDNRQGNVFAYVTPEMAGMQLTAAYISDMDKDRSDNNDQSAWNVSFTGKMGPIFAGVSYVNMDGDTFGASAVDTDAWRFVMVANMSGMKFTTHYSDYNDLNGVKNNDLEVWGVGLAYKFGANEAKIQYVNGDAQIDAVFDDDENVDLVGGNRPEMIAVGMDHKMSKRTKAYIVYAMIDDSQGQTSWKASHGVSTSVAAGEDKVDALSLGMIHKF